MVLDTQIVLKNSVTLRATFEENSVTLRGPHLKKISSNNTQFENIFCSSLETILPQKEALDHAKIIK